MTSQAFETATSEHGLTLTEHRQLHQLRLPAHIARSPMNEYEDVLARDWPEDARRMRGSISEQDPEASENESQSSEDEAMSEVGQSHSEEVRSQSYSGQDESDFSDDESHTNSHLSEPGSGDEDPLNFEDAVDMQLKDHAAQMPSAELAALALSDDYRNTMEEWLFVTWWGPER